MQKRYGCLNQLAAQALLDGEWQGGAIYNLKFQISKKWLRARRGLKTERWAPARRSWERNMQKSHDPQMVGVWLRNFDTKQLAGKERQEQLDHIYRTKAGTSRGSTVACGYPWSHRGVP